MKYSEIKTLTDFRNYNNEKAKRYYERNKEKVKAKRRERYRKKVEELRIAEEKMKKARTAEEILLETLGVDPVEFIDE